MVVLTKAATPEAFLVEALRHGLAFLITCVIPCIAYAYDLNILVYTV